MDNSFSATERGYLTDVSDSASPSGEPDIATPSRRRFKYSDTNINRKNIDGSLSDSDDDHVRRPRFERKPPKGKSRRRSENIIFRESKPAGSKRHSYDPTKRFSWTDSGISSSMGTGPNTMKSIYSDPIPPTVVHLEKIRDKEPIPSLDEVVCDTFNAVNELKDLQKSIRKAQQEHDSHKSLVIANTPTKTFQPSTPLHHNLFKVEDVESNKPDIIDTEVKRKTSDMVKVSCNQETIEKLSTKDSEKGNTRRTSKTRSNELEDENRKDSKKEIKISDETPKPSGGRTNKNKGFIKGLRKVASHFKPTFVTNKHSKDVTSEFLFEKRKVDEDTLKEFQTITTKFRNEVNYLQNMSIDDIHEAPLDEENIRNILLEQLTYKPSKNMSFMQRVFGQSKTYKAKPLKKTKKGKSICENVFISSCNANTYTSSVETNNKNDNKINNDNRDIDGNCDDDNNNNDNTYRTKSSQRSKSCTLTTKGESCMKTSICTLSPNEESFIENRRCTLSPKGEYSKPNPDGTYNRYLVNDQDISSEKCSYSKQLSRAQSMSHVRMSKFETQNESFPRQCNVNLQQVYSYSSSDLLGHNNCDIYDSECDECVYSDYLDFLQFRRFRKSSRCDRYCRWPRETYDDNGYGTYTDYTDHHCQCGSENSWYTQQNNQIREYNDMACENNHAINDEIMNMKININTEDMASYGTYV